MKSATTAISGIFPAFSAGKKISSKIGLDHILGIPNTHLYVKIQTKPMMKSREYSRISLSRTFKGPKYLFEIKRVRDRERTI